VDVGGVEGVVVDADFVDEAVEEAGEGVAVGADLPAVGVAGVAGEGCGGDLGAVDVEAGGGAA
jgi:hypothetical protein